MEERWYELEEEAAAATNLTEMMYLKRQRGQSSDAAAMRRQQQQLCLGRQLLLPLPLPPPSPDSSLAQLDAAAHIKVGSYYEIDHSKLPTKAPDQLKCARVIMVSKKSKCSVSLRYPSVFSLRAHFSERSRRKMEARMLPSLDEQYAMRAELAAEVLYRRVPPHEVAVQRNQWCFWAVLPSPEMMKNPAATPIVTTTAPTAYLNVGSKHGLCLSMLKSTGMVRWGRQRQVRFLCSHELEERREKQSLSRRGKGKEEERPNIEDDEEEEDDDGDGDEGNDDEGEGEGEEEEKEMRVSDEDNSETDTKTNKRKGHGASCRVQKPKKPKHDDDQQNQQIILYKPSKVKNWIERWSVQRYNLAEENMLKIMKEKGAVFGHPIMRPELRAEARKLIGDTGLLDHLLKHMAGKVAPGGEDRFMRRHNANGAMEYWLESADLMDIRKEAGVQDPYWTPPPGWKLGDNPAMDPICARELKDLREEITKLKATLETKNNPEDDQALPRDRNSSVANRNLVHDMTQLLPLKEKYIDMMNRKAQLEGQMADIAKSLCGLEEDMVKLRSSVEDLNKPDSAETTLLKGLTPPPLGTGREAKEMEKSNKDVVVIISDEEEQDRNPAAGSRARRNAVVATTEEKAAKIERLKSGFKICKPQGSFLWPNMALSRQVVVPIDDILAITTPPSVSSSAAPRLLPSPPPQVHTPNQTSSTVKPLAERPSSIGVNSSSSQHAKCNSIINLNEVPCNPQDYATLGSHSVSHNSPCSLTYRRRHHHHHHLSASTSKAPLQLIPAKTESEMNQKQKGLSTGAGTWLALSTSSSSMAMGNHSRSV